MRAVYRNLTEGAMAGFTFTVNGIERTVDVVPEMPLLWVLRDFLGLTGTKYGCGVGACGSCTCRIDGEATRSCVTPVSEVDGKAIETIEGLSADGDHPLQRAWIEDDVAQCGYCQPGMLMSAAALLDSRPKPTDDDIDDALDHHVCRCGTYDRIRRAIHRAAEEV
jgi:aerobic-type carbon monoxide dehydrogenase small subunit (CoxS/CutS family)